ncbi:hypothetical protein D3C86_1490380 [compost metagenome]
MNYFNMKNDALGMQFRLTENLQRIAKASMKTDYTGIPTTTMGKSGAKLATLESEMFTKIVIGNLPITEFDTFVEEWKKNGGNDITKEVNEAYKSMKK